MNIFQLSLLLAILLKCVTASESGVAQDVIDALEEPGFVSIKNDWEKWIGRKDLFDHVVTRSVEFIIGFIKQVEWIKIRTLAAVFIKRSDVVDQMLKKIKYDDNDLIHLTDHRPELAESHDKFFKAIDKIKSPKYQEEAVRRGVIKLFDTKKHASVISLINALEKREFNGRDLTNVAIRQAFDQGALNGIKDIVEKFHEHPAITSEEYAIGLIRSWRNDKLKTFQFLLSQADQGDLEKVKKGSTYKNNQEFHEAIDDAFPRAEPAGSRHDRFLNKERVRLAKEAFADTPSINLSQKQWPENIIFDYILG